MVDTNPNSNRNLTTTTNQPTTSSSLFGGANEDVNTTNINDEGTAGVAGLGGIGEPSVLLLNENIGEKQQSNNNISDNISQMQAVVVANTTPSVTPNVGENDFELRNNDNCKQDGDEATTVDSKFLETHG